MDYRCTNFTASTGSFAIDYYFGLGGAWNPALDGVSVIGRQQRRRLHSRDADRRDGRQGSS